MAVFVKTNLREGRFINPLAFLLKTLIVVLLPTVVPCEGGTCDTMPCRDVQVFQLRNTLIKRQKSLEILYKAVLCQLMLAKIRRERKKRFCVHISVKKSLLSQRQVK